MARTVETVTTIYNSITGKELKETEATQVFLALDEKGVLLDLGPTEVKALNSVLKPYFEAEEAQSATEYYAPKRKRRQIPTAEERAAISAFVEKEGLGVVAKAGMVKKAFIEAWEKAGRPGIESASEPTDPVEPTEVKK